MRSDRDAVSWSLPPRALMAHGAVAAHHLTDQSSRTQPEQSEVP
jgi:hypothetical protein